MTVEEFLRQATSTLQAAGIDSARLDCLILLEDALGFGRASILAHPETVINAAKVVKLNTQVTQRTSHIPLAYIRGRAHFFGREFIVNPSVLVPRPETEIMIEMLKKLPLPARPEIADIGTGSGCIGTTAALELTDARVGLYDIDPEALRVATQNVEALRANAACQISDLLDRTPAVDVILANLPYVPENHAVNRAARHEPKHAIFSGSDGLALYARFWKQIDDLTHKPMYVLTETLQTQHTKLTKLAQNAGYKTHDAQDLIQVFKRA